jgi:hypothetical protein
LKIGGTATAKPAAKESFTKSRRASALDESPDFSSHRPSLLDIA